jgi:hypothetical protein
MARLWLVLDLSEVDPEVDPEVVRENFATDG